MDGIELEKTTVVDEQQVVLGQGTEEMIISLHALSSSDNNDTIKVVGSVKKNKIMLLIDSGSTYNFLDPVTAKTISCELQPSQPIMVTMGDEYKVMSTAFCPKFCWEMQGHKYETEMRVPWEVVKQF